MVTSFFVAITRYLYHIICAENIFCVYLRQVIHVFPDDQLLIDTRIEAHIGKPLPNAAGAVIGLIVGLYEHQVPDCEQAKMLCQLSSDRITAVF
jgi:hypothetical protein